MQGFTLIEIMVVLVIMGLLISLVGPSLFGVLTGANQKKVFADFDSIDTALSMYRLQNFNYPTSEQGLQALVEKTTIDPVPRKFQEDGYLPRLPVDPWGREYLYLSPGEQGKYDLYTLGRDGVPGGGDEDADIGNWQTLQEVETQ
jgi:general secretion pathway protein G